MAAVHEAAIRDPASRDRLTGLPNRFELRDALHASIERGDELGSGGAVRVLGLDRFKQVNDALGDAFGDRQLQAVAARGAVRAAAAGACGAPGQ